jgi:hypothetical protein
MPHMVTKRLSTSKEGYAVQVANVLLAVKLTLDILGLSPKILG